jgi:hypothetical protein
MNTDGSGLLRLDASFSFPSQLLVTGLKSIVESKSSELRTATKIQQKSHL